MIFDGIIYHQKTFEDTKSSNANTKTLLLLGGIVANSDVLPGFIAFVENDGTIP